MAKFTLPCIACGQQLKQITDDAATNQPYAGTAFVSHGHHGSTAYDPMDGRFLEINICDVCLVFHHDRVVEGRDKCPVKENGMIVSFEDVPPHERWKTVPWMPERQEVNHVLETAIEEFEIGAPQPEASQTKGTA